MHLCMFLSIPETLVGFLGEESTRVSGLTWVTFSHSNELANVAGTDNSVNVDMSLNSVINKVQVVLCRSVRR